MEYIHFLPWICLIFLLGAGGILLWKLPRAKPKPSPYVATPLLTDAERQFFVVLEACLPQHCYLLAQVRLANLVRVKSENTSFWKDFSPIAMKCLDFVVVRRDTMTPVSVVKLEG